MFLSLPLFAERVNIQHQDTPPGVLPEDSMYQNPATRYHNEGFEAQEQHHEQLRNEAYDATQMKVKSKEPKVYDLTTPQ